MISLNIFKHLLPRAKAWRLTIDKQLRQFFSALSTSIIDTTKQYYDLIWLDIFPETTRQLDEWEKQFGIVSSGITEQERRDRLASTWQALGGQSPTYIQNTLQNNGFDVYVHEWWETGTEPPVARNPLLVLNNQELTVYIVECGEPLAECGEPTAECGASDDPQGYALVNKVFRSEKDFRVECGQADAECGEPGAECGEFEGYVDVQIFYPIPTDPQFFPYFLYIGGPNFGDIATVQQLRRNEFEDLCLKICPTQQWLGILVNYS